MFEMKRNKFDFYTTDEGVMMLPALVGTNKELQMLPMDEYEAGGGFETYCRVGSDHVGSLWVSTVLLLTMHTGGQFETMVFPDGGYDEIQVRYATYEEALEGHKRIVKMLLDGLSQMEINAIIEAEF